MALICGRHRGVLITEFEKETDRGFFVWPQLPRVIIVGGFIRGILLNLNINKHCGMFIYFLNVQ